MKNLESLLLKPILLAVKNLFGADLPEHQVNFQTTRKEFQGDVTLVVFPIVRFAKKSPEETAEVIGNYLVKTTDFIDNFNVVKGFLNLVVSESYWLESYALAFNTESYGRVKATKSDPKIVVEYSSPNTNKPLQRDGRVADVHQSIRRRVVLSAKSSIVEKGFESFRKLVDRV